MTGRALIFGVGGQDGSYLAELLLGKGYVVYGTVRRSSGDNTARVAHLLGNPMFGLLRADLLDAGSVRSALAGANPTEVYNLADQDHVGWSESCPSYSIAVTAGGAQTVLDAVLRSCELPYGIRVLQPISATVFGNAPPGQTVDTRVRPMSPYSCAKAHAWHLARYYREKYKMFVACPVLYNHDSPRRGPDYLLQKIARGVKPDGDLGLTVDIGYAPEFVEAMWLMLQRDEPMDEVIGTGVSYTVGDLWEYGSARRRGGTGLIRRSGIIHQIVGWLTPNTESARTRLGWQARSDAADALALIIDARRSSDGKGKGEGREQGEPLGGKAGQVLGVVDGAGRTEGERPLPGPGGG